MIEVTNNTKKKAIHIKRLFPVITSLCICTFPRQLSIEYRILSKMFLFGVSKNNVNSRKIDYTQSMK